MLAESEGSDHLDFQEHSKGELQYFYSSNTQRSVLLLTLSAPPPLPSRSSQIKLRSLFSWVQHFSLCLHYTGNITLFSEKLRHCKTSLLDDCFLFPCSFSMEWRLEGEESDFSRFRVVFFVIIQHGGCITKWKFCNSSVLHKYRTFHTYEKKSRCWIKTNPEYEVVTVFLVFPPVYFQPGETVQGRIKMIDYSRWL